MQKLGPYYIGQMSLYSLRGWIIDNSLTEADTVLLHPATLELVMNEYRQLYREAMPDPYYLLGVLIDEANGVRVPENRVVTLVGDDRADRPIQPVDKAAGPVDDGRDIFRCGQCSSIINEQGEVLKGEARNYSIALLRMRGDAGTRHVGGECCKNFY